MNLPKRSPELSTEHRHFLLHKPYGYLSQFISNQSKAHKKNYLGELFDFPQGTMAVGRLDEASEGLLLLTTDGKLSEIYRSKKVEKEYFAQLDGQITDEAIRILNEKVVISLNGKSYSCSAKRAVKIQPPDKLPKRKKSIRSERHGPTSWISITLNEGKFRQVRKMCAAVGYPCLRLIRIRIGLLNFSMMNRENCIELKEDQIRLPSMNEIH